MLVRVAGCSALMTGSVPCKPVRVMSRDNVPAAVSSMAVAVGRCGNINWARRTECNICHEPKLGKVEARTGLGGGYNERENVEYIDRPESDDEFDEVGTWGCLQCVHGR